MNKSKIEWCDYTVNPIKGLCPMACDYCYARAMYKRFKWNPEIRYISKMNLLNELLSIPRDKPARIFMGSTFELFGDWVKPEWLTEMFELVRNFPFFTFIFLTKQPQNLIKWSPFPDNCWVGVSVCNDKMLDVAVDKLEDIQSKMKFISFEPLLERLTLSLDYAFYYSGISWCIIGQQTPVRKATMPKLEWVREIVEAGDKAGIPIFLKDNLWNTACIYEGEKGILFNDKGLMRQEFPQ